MFTRSEIENAIKEYEDKASSFSDCEKLAAFYTVYAYKYAQPEPIESRATYAETVIDDYGDSEFFDTIRDKEAVDVWEVMDELMTVLRAIKPNLYEGTLRKLREI